MAFTKGNNLSNGRPKGSLNKTNPEIGNRLDNVINGLMDSIDIDDLNTSQKIKMLQISLQYRLPKLQAINSINETTEQLPFPQIQIVTTQDEKQRLDKVQAYEKEHNVQIL